MAGATGGLIATHRRPYHRLYIPVTIDTGAGRGFRIILWVGRVGLRQRAPDDFGTADAIYMRRVCEGFGLDVAGCAVEGAEDRAFAHVHLMSADSGEGGFFVVLSILGWCVVGAAAVADIAVFRRAGVAGQTGGVSDASCVVTAVAVLAVTHIPVVTADRLTVEVLLGRGSDPALGMDAGSRTTGDRGIVPAFAAGAEAHQYQDEQTVSGSFEYVLHGPHLLP